MEVAGLVIGVAALWESCVQIFEIVDSARHYGMEYELLSAKLEVERVRLLCWGDAVGLNNLEGGNAAPGPDARFQREEVRGAVVRLLGCIQHVFENSERLQEQYGLRPATAAPVPDQGQPPSQSQMILRGVFKRAYENLRRSARDRQSDTPLTRKTVWAVHDRKKFVGLVVEIRGFNDSLESLFPSAQIKAAIAMQGEIDAAVDVHELQLLQEAMAGEHEELSDRASQRLEELGATVSARTELLSRTRSEADEDEDDDVETIGDSNQAALVPSTKEAGEVDAAPEEELDEASRRLREVEQYVEKKSAGALTLALLGPYGNLPRVTGHVYYEGDKRDSSWPSYWDDRDKGFVITPHASFEYYKKRKYMRKNTRDKYDSPDSEDYVYLDAEAHQKFENVNPGTVTVEGFGLECWSFANTKPRNETILVNHSQLPVLPARKLLRRFNELQTNPGKFGWRSVEEELNLKDFVGTLGIVYYDEKYARERDRWVGDLYSVLNRTDIFADFTTESSIGIHCASSGDNDFIGIWNFLRQIIVAKELAMRLEHLDGARSYTGFTPRILATLIVSDLWFKNLEIILTDEKMKKSSIKRPETEQDRMKAEDFKNQGNDAMRRKEFQKAIDSYTEAIKIDLGNAVYRCNRSAASMGLGNNDHAWEDAYVATQLDPKYAKAWSRLGMALVKEGQYKRAKKTYEKAIAVAGKEATAAMRQGLADAEAKLKETIAAINSETDQEKQHNLHTDYLDQDWEIMGKSVELHSRVHEQQVEGLLFFAERMKWPYINEVRDYAEDVYSNLRGGTIINIHLHDWLFGAMLPGKFFAFKLMTALVLCTPSVKDKVGIARYYECGFSLPTRSYWRCRTVLGSVLGCIPGVVQMGGWIGPCPRVQFDDSIDGNEPRHIRIKTRRVAPIEHRPDDNTISFGAGYDRWDATRIQADEEIEPYLAEMKDSSKWIIPEPPVRDVGTVELESIQLRTLPLEVNIALKAGDGGMDDLDVQNETQYRASLVFKFDNNEQPVTYKLFTNPVFISLPPCRSNQKGEHEVHMRELARYQQNIWSIDRLKDHTPEDFNRNEVMIINATGKGAEVLARAWCSERGKHAAIRRVGGPCFVCAVRAASKGSLDTGVLIWVD